MLGLFIIAIIATLFIIESSRRGVVDTLISPIWVFTLFYVLSYPLRYYLIIEYEIEIIAGTKPTNDLLLLSLCLSFVAWVFMFTIYKFFEINKGDYLFNSLASELRPYNLQQITQAFNNLKDIDRPQIEDWRKELNKKETTNEAENWALPNLKTDR